MKFPFLSVHLRKEGSIRFTFFRRSLGLFVLLSFVGFGSFVPLTLANVAPNANNLNAAETYTEDTSLNLTDIVTSDADNTTLTVTLTLSNPAAGSLTTGTSGAVTSTYNAGPGTWTASGAIANVNVLLAGVTFVPAANFNSNFTITTNVSDGSLSVSGTKNMTGIPVNDAPVLDASKSPTLTTLNEDAGPPSGAVGTLVSSIVDFATPSGQVDNVTDVDSGAVLGIAVTAIDSSNSTCYYTLDNGNTWTAMGAVSNSSARLLAANATNRIYCQPNPNVNGVLPGILTFRAWDQTSGTDGSLADTTTSGGTSAFSTATDTASLVVTAVNDAPVLDSSKSPALATLNEDAGAPVGAVGTLVSSIVDSVTPSGGLDNVTDVDSGALLGIAITSVDNAHLTCYYSLNSGTTWTAIGSVSNSSARLLAANGTNRIYCRPGADLNGTFPSALTFRVWDQTSGSDGSLADTTTNGGTSAFSTATDTVSLVVTAVNDAPVLDSSKSPTLTTLSVNASAPSGLVGTPVSSIVDFATPSGQVDNVTDVDSGAALGIAITDTDSANLTCYYTLDSGNTWTAIGSVSNSSALLLAANGTNRIYCQPGANLLGTFPNALTFRAWDQTSGTDGTLADATSTGGSTAFSSSTDTVSLMVTGDFHAGNGTSGNPYQITSCQELQNINNHLSDSLDNSYYILTANIDCSATNPGNGNFDSATWGSSNGFVPIGNGSTPFKGNVDGGNYKITNLYINQNVSDVGLFGALDVDGGFPNSGKISNLGLENVTITNGGNESTGALVGYSLGTVTNCYSTGSVTGVNEVGGLVGSNDGQDTIIGSYSTATVSGGWSIGGLAGANYGTIETSYATGQITSTSQTSGGLVGFNNGTISDTFSTGDVNGTYSVGGLVGENSGTILRSYANNGSLVATDYAGGLTGINYGDITDSYSTWTMNQLQITANGSFIGYYGGGTLTNNAVYTSNGLDAIGSDNVNNGGLADTLLQDKSYGINVSDITTLYATNHQVYNGQTPWNFSSTWISHTTGFPTLRGLPDPNAVDLQNGLEAHWDFDEAAGNTAYDATGNGNDGTLQNSPTRVIGKFGNALSFNGTDTSVVIGNKNFGLTNAFTVSTWVKLNEINSRQIIVAKSTGGNNSWLVEVDPADCGNGGISFFLNTTGVQGSGTSFCSNTTLSAGQWYHLDFTYDGSTARIYIGGSVDASQALSGSLFNNSVSTIIGNWMDADRPFNGLIDDLRIYNRALSLSETQALHTGEDIALIGYWKMDESSGTTAADSSGNSHDGTVVGNAHWVSGKFGNAFQFDGSTVIKTTFPLSTTAYTKSAWIKLSSCTSANNIISSADDVGTAFLAPNNPTCILISGENGTWSLIQDSTPLSVGQWYFVAITYDSQVDGGTMKLYRDGVLVNTINNIAPPGSSDIYIGGHNVDNYFQGLIDDARVYDRALSAADIANMYAVGTQPVPNFSVSFSGSTPQDGSTLLVPNIEVALSSGPGSQYALTDFNNSLKLWLTMDNNDGSGNPTDISSHQVSITNNGATLTNSGKFGKGLVLNGGHLTLPRPVQDDFTICAWIKTGIGGDGTNHYQTEPVLESETGNLAPDFGFGVDSNGHMAFGIGSQPNGYGDNTINSATYVSDNQWHHVCGLRTKQSSLNNLNIYVDGHIDATGTGSTDTLDSNDTAVIGTGTDGGTDFYGTIDDLVVFDRVLSPQEIASLFDAQSHQYDDTFTYLPNGTYPFTGYAVDATGHVVSTASRNVTIAAPAPNINSLSPSSGTIAGGTIVTIAGSNFQNGATVTFGGVSATNIDVNQAGDQITATTPAHNAGQVDVVITNPGAQIATAQNGFKYITIAPPNASPNSGNSFTVSQQISLSKNSDATGIYYTLDGSTPDCNSLTGTNYSVPFNIFTTVTLKARSCYTDNNQSVVASFTYTKNPHQGGIGGIVGGGGGGSSIPTTVTPPTSPVPQPSPPSPVPTPTPPPSIKQEPFTDMIGHWAHDFVFELYTLKVVQGRAPHFYVPEGNLTRAEAVKIGLLSFGYPLDANNFHSGFKDLDKNAWYIPYIRKAKKEGFISGLTFRPNEPITRADALVMYLKMAKKLAKAPKSPFQDVKSSAFYAPYVDYAYAEGIIEGRGTKGISFEPLSTITRAEIAKIVLKIMKL